MQAQRIDGMSGYSGRRPRSEGLHFDQIDGNGESHQMLKDDASRVGDTSDELIIHLSMGDAAYDMLLWVKETSEAKTFGEVIRRAMQALELFEPTDIQSGVPTKPVTVMTDATTSASNPEELSSGEHGCHSVSVRVSSKTKARIDTQKARLNTTYSEVVRHALRVLAQLLRNRARYLSVQKGGENGVAYAFMRDRSRCSELDNGAELIALV